MSARSARFVTDLRFVIGALLVIAAIAGVWAVVAAARQTTTVWVATRTLVPGDDVRASDLREAEAGLGELTPAYVSASTDLAGGVVVRVIEAGSLVPVGSIAEEGADETTTVVVSTTGTLAEAVAAGRGVELWATNPDAKDPRPHLLVADAVVARVDDDAGGVVAQGAAVELVVPRAAVTDVLAAQAAGAVLAVIPAAGGDR